MRILIIRHADPEYHGDTLTAAGHAEAAALGARLARGLEGRPDFLYTSPLGRARDTASAIAVAAASPPPGVTPRTLTPTVEGWTRELSHWPRLGEGLAAGDAAAGWDGLVAASDAFLARHGYERHGGRYKVAARNTAVVAVVCHGGFGLTWLAHLLRLDLAAVWTSFWLAPSSVTTVLFDERTRGWATPRCIGLSDISHLEAARLSISDSRYEKPNAFGDHPRPSGIKANFR